MSAYVVVQTAAEPKQYPCERVLTIGRVPPNDVILTDPKVSRHHAIIRLFGDRRYHLVDLGSANGCLVNGRRVIVPCALANGDRIHIGEQMLTFYDADIQTPQIQESDSASTMMTYNSKVQEIVVLVADIRNFSQMSEQIEVCLLAQVIGRWFGMVTSIVEEHQGVVDKFIGDAVMVRWVSLRGQAGAMTTESLKTACALHGAANKVNEEFPDLPGPLKIGVGINMGHAVLGNVGSSRARDYTALGDSVNLAFRIEKASKELGKGIVVGDDAYKHLPASLQCGHPETIVVKGKEAPITVHAFDCEEIHFSS